MTNGWLRHVALGTSVAVALLAYGQSVGDEQLLATIRAGNKNSRQLIRTLHVKCKITQRGFDKVGRAVPLAEKGIEWWQEDSRVRWTEETKATASATSNREGASTRTVRREGVINAAGEVKVLRHSRVNNGKWTVDAAGIRPYSQNELIASDVWVLALFVILPRPRFTLSDLLSDPKAVKSVTSFYEQGQLRHRLIVAAPAPVADYQIEVVVDPSHNYLVTSSSPTSSSPNEVLRFKKKVLSFLECEPGIYFPKVVQSTTLAVTPEKTTRVVAVNRVDFQVVEVNQSIASGLFELSFPPGTPVVDKRDDTTYIMGADQKPVGPIAPAPTGHLSLTQPTYLEEQRTWHWWVIAGSAGGLLVVAGGVWRLMRSQAATKK